MEAKTVQKIVVIGHVMTGKTCLMQRYTSGRYSQEKYKSTVGADFSTKDLHFGDYHVNLQVWDTAGTERFASVGREFYRGADMCVLVYAVDDALSFTKLSFWYDTFVDAAGVAAEASVGDFPLVVLGNKCDLPEEAHVVPPADVAAWCKDRGGIPHFLVSALTGENVDEAFGAAVKAAIVRRVKEEAAEESIAGSAATIKLGRGGGGAADGGPDAGGAGCAC